SKSRTCPFEALTVYPRPRKRPTLRALAGDSTITSLPVGAEVRCAAAAVRFLVRRVVLPRFFAAVRVTRSGLGSPACASVAPMRNKAVPHTEHAPRVPGVPLLL